MTDFPSSPESSTLKPCPFCGEPADDWHGSFGEYVSCSGCGARSGDSPSQKEAREWWNVRTSDLAPSLQQSILKRLCEPETGHTIHDVVANYRAIRRDALSISSTLGNTR